MGINQKEKRKDGREKLKGGKALKREIRRRIKKKKSKREFCQTNLV
jgi:hypothetical protein